VRPLGIPIASLQNVPNPEQKDLAEAPRKSRIWLVVVMAVLAASVAGLWFFVPRGAESAIASEDSSEIKSTLHLETFVLNLADSDERAYLRVGIDLGLGQEPRREDPVPVSEVRDAILGVLAQGKVDDLLTAAGKNQLKKDLLTALQQRLPQLEIREIYFTEFLIQR